MESRSILNANFVKKIVRVAPITYELNANKIDYIRIESALRPSLCVFELLAVAGPTVVVVRFRSSWSASGASIGAIVLLLLVALAVVLTTLLL